LIDLIYKDESRKIIGAAIEVHKTLGNGFLEPVYQEALMIEFDIQNIPYEKEKQLRIRYKDGYLTKYYMADFVCFNKILIECKALNSLLPEHESQVINYLYATDLNLGLLFNFGKRKIEIKRIANLDGRIKRKKNPGPTEGTEYTE
jgi:GxxExxY protein